MCNALDLESDESKILSLLESDANSDQQTKVIVSQELIEQILRVGKRLQNKDWSSGLLARLWQQLQIDFIFVDDQDIQAIASFPVKMQEFISPPNKEKPNALCQETTS